MPILGKSLIGCLSLTDRMRCKETRWKKILFPNRLIVIGSTIVLDKTRLHLFGKKTIMDLKDLLFVTMESGKFFSTITMKFNPDNNLSIRNVPNRVASRVYRGIDKQLTKRKLAEIGLKFK